MSWVNVRDCEQILSNFITACRKYARNIHQAKPTVFTILSATKRAEFHVSRTIIGKRGLSCTKRVRQVKLGFLEGGDEGKHNGFTFVMTHNTRVFGVLG